MADANVSALRRRRGTVKSSITKLASKIDELERATSGPAPLARVQQLVKRLGTLDSEFKARHFEIVDIIDGEEILTAEQDELDGHDDIVMDLEFRLQSLTTTSPDTVAAPHSAGTPNRAIIERRSAQLQGRIQSTHDRIASLKGDGTDMHLVCLFQEQLIDLKRELSS